MAFLLGGLTALQAPSSPAGPTSLEMALAAVAALAALLSAIFAFITILPILRQRRTDRLLADRFGADAYAPEILHRATMYYIPPNCTSIDPASESEMRNLVTTEEKLFDVLERFLDKDSRHRHLLILADSGMGKSSCLINYYVRNQKLQPRRRKRIAVIPLGIPRADDLIRRIDDKERTVLFLDAFDEDTKAIRDHRSRLLELMDICRDFNRVVLTCRTQFFPRDEEIPKDTGIVKVEPKRAGEHGTYVFQKLYLAPLNNDQVTRFLRRRYPAPQWKRRRSARKFVDAVPLLSVRPMLLAHIPDLVQSEREIRYGFELYEALIESWLQRESAWAAPEILRQFSEQLAVDLYCNRERRGAEWIPAADLAQLVKEWSLALEDWQLTGRSLLNRDAAGNYKFAHRSILEYLFVRESLAGNPCAMSAEWTDQMREFLREIIFSASLPMYLGRWRGALAESDVRRILRVARIYLRCEGRDFTIGPDVRVEERVARASVVPLQAPFRSEHLQVTKGVAEATALGLQWINSTMTDHNLQYLQGDRTPTLDELVILDHFPGLVRALRGPRKDFVCGTADTLRGAPLFVRFSEAFESSVIQVEAIRDGFFWDVRVRPAAWLRALIAKSQDTAAREGEISAPNVPQPSLVSGSSGSTGGLGAGKKEKSPRRDEI